MNSTAQLALDPQAHLPTGPTHVVSRSPESRASNEARAWLVVADVTPTGYRVGKFLASHARYATAADVRRHVVPGEIFCYWRQATIAAELGCSERQVRRGVRSLREAGALDVRRRVRPCEASYVFHASKAREGSRGCDEGATNGGSDVLSDVRSGVLSGVLSGVRSHTEPRTEPPREPERKHGGSTARVVCERCGHSWPDKPEYGTKCHECNYIPAVERPDTPEPKACTCGETYRNSYSGRCVDCKGEPSAAQRDALREKHGCGGVDDGRGVDGGGADNPSVPETDERAETETRQPPETRGQSPDSFLPQKQEIPPDGGEPGPNKLRWYADFGKWTVGKRTPTQHGSDRRRMARTARHELADLAKGGQDDDGH